MNVCFGSKADICAALAHVRFPKSGHLALFDYLVGAGEQARRDS